MMRYFDVFQLVSALEFISEAGLRCGDVINGISSGRDAYIEQGIKDDVGPKIAYLREKCVECELTVAVMRIDGPIFQGLRDGITFDELKNQIRELQRDIKNEMQYRMFVFVAVDKAKLLIGLSATWDAVWKKFPDCKLDCGEAVDCYAIGKNTACVFHLMRVAEHGLRALAKRLRVSLTHKSKNQPIEYADWEKVINGIKVKIGEARSRPHGKRRADDLTFYSDIADHATYMKDYWRNDVSHARKTYNDPEALAALIRVRAFMEKLGENMRPIKARRECDKFNNAMDTILKANPKIVKAAMEAEKEERAQVRKAKRAVSRASTAKG